MASILIIDDDKVFCDILAAALTGTGHKAAFSHSLAGGLRKAQTGEHDLVLVDVGLPDGNGIDAIVPIQEANSSPEIIIVTGSADQSGAELAIRSGAWDYIEKPSSIHEMMLPIFRALRFRQERRFNSKNEGARHLRLDGIVGDSPKMRSCFDQLTQVAASDMSVLITGETGTGKELFASAIHQNSPRKRKPFVVLDCSVLPESLVESILFGHDKGAFTGAHRPRTGLIKQADGGTLFLDEVGELPLPVQRSFLRVLQERRFRPVGSAVEIRSDFRLIAATNRDLQAMVQEKTFRGDLLFRLNSFQMVLPPLRNRPEDIPALARHHVTVVGERQGSGQKLFSPEFVEALIAYDWPGNVRELFHALERSLAAAHYESTLIPQHLPDEIRIYLARHSLRSTEPSSPKLNGKALSIKRLPPFRAYKERMERIYLEELSSITSGNISESCRISGLSRSRLYDLLKQHSVMPAAALARA
ncbi:MAG: sigma-54-dependent transcriptional regulator [Syntrophobacteraceae bacterium]